MCFQTSLVKSWNDWNWNGDAIVYPPIVPASRPIPGAKIKKRFSIDVREYLTTTNNAVVGERLNAIIRKLPPYDQLCFRSKSLGSFDLRADTILESFSDLRYLPKANVTARCPDAWLYPDETLAQGGGDCEDLAFMLAALLLAAGISGYCVRVALGSLHITLPDGKTQKHDHCWVMYQNERAVWEILEPMTEVGGRSGKSRSGPIRPLAQKLEYIPHYVFNIDHLWQIHSRDFDRGTPGSQIIAIAGGSGTNSIPASPLVSTTPFTTRPSAPRFPPPPLAPSNVEACGWTSTSSPTTRATILTMATSPRVGIG